MLSLNQMLIDFDVAHLRAIASCLGIPLESNAPRDIADQLTGALLTPDSLTEILARLSPAEREALADLQRAGGRLRAHLFLHRFGEIRLWGAGRLERERPWERPVGPAEALWHKGLLGRGFAQEAGETIEFIFIPRDLLRHLPAPPERPKAPIIAQAPSAVEPAERPDALEDLFQLLVYIQLRRPRPSPEGALSAEDAARVQGNWSGAADGAADEPAARLVFLQHAARRLGLIEVQANRLRLAGEAARGWLGQPAALQRRALQDAWRSDDVWNDLAHVPTLRLEMAGWANDAPRTRQTFLKHLGALPAGAWHALAGFCASMHAGDPDFQRPNGDYQSWYIHDRGSDALLQGFEHWDAVEGALIAYYLRRPLHWLGVIAWSRQPADYFCITEAGARFLAGELELVSAPAGDPLQVGDDLTIALTPEASLYHRLQVERFAERCADARSYRMTPRSLLQARAQEIPLEAARRFLERAAGAPLSDTADAELRHCWNAFNRVRTRRLVLLEFAAPEVLEWLRGDAEAAPLLGRAVSEQSVIVSESRLSRLLARLRRLGLNAEVVPEAPREA